MRKWITIKVSRLFIIECILGLLLLVKLFSEYIILSKTSNMVFGIIIKGYEGLSIIACIACFIFCWLLAWYASWVCKDSSQKEKEENKKERGK